MPRKKSLPAAKGRKSRTRKPAPVTRQVAEYRHKEETPARPDVGTQPQSKKRAAPKTYRYEPDFIVRLPGRSDRYLILETKGFDELEEVKREAATRWAHAVNAEGSFGAWFYDVAKKVSDVPGLIAKYATA